MRIPIRKLSPTERLQTIPWLLALAWAWLPHSWKSVAAGAAEVAHTKTPLNTVNGFNVAREHARQSPFRCTAGRVQWKGISWTDCPTLSSLISIKLSMLLSTGLVWSVGQAFSGKLQNWGTGEPGGCSWISRKPPCLSFGLPEYILLGWVFRLKHETFGGYRSGHTP